MTLTQSEAKKFYDWVGARQDSQAFYEDGAIDELIAHADFPSAQHVFELGCGTGRLAERLLAHHLPPSATYEGIDLSTTMVAIAQQRLARFGARATVRQASAFGADVVCDRVIATYVFDLLPEDDIRTFLADSARVLASGGRLCVANLTFGTSLVTRTVSAMWNLAFRIAPRAVGGCRPLQLRPHMSDARWHVIHEAVVSSFGIASEVLVAEKMLPMQ